MASVKAQGVIVELLDQLIQKLTRRLEAEIASVSRPEGAFAPARPAPAPALPRRETASSPDSCWIPPGRPVTVAGYTIEGGMIYVGGDLSSVSGYRGAEPALIDPSLPVHRRTGTSPETAYYYWPTYKDLTPTRRAAYLAWLAGGRQDPAAPVSHIFLFFYGLERRLLVDSASAPATWDDADEIVSEVERLRGIYDHYSFQSYADSFLKAVAALRGGVRVYEGPPPAAARSWELPLQLKIGLGQLAAERKPIPSDWALAWLRLHPDTRLLTPATRCREEFERLWALRYRDRYGEGLVVKPNKRRLRAAYHPASPSFAGRITLPVGDLPDVTSLSSPVNKLAEVADGCCVELNAYSRWLGRHHGDRESLGAMALLPADLSGGDASDEVADLCRWIETLLGEREIETIEGGELIARWRKDTPAKLSKGESANFTELLSRHGYGIEPDVRFDGPVLSEGPAVLFRQANERFTLPGPTYRSATLLVQLAVVVGSAGGGPTEAQKRHIASHLGAAAHLTAAQRQRLRAHLHWRIATGARLTGLKYRLAALHAEQRAGIGRFLVGVASAGGHISPEEITLLTRVYKLLDLPPGEVYSHVHAAAVAPPAADPVTVRQGSRPRLGYRVPPRPSAELRPSEVALDRGRVEAGLADAEAVSTLLGTIFRDEEEEEAAAIGTMEGPVSLAGLDAAHSSLLRALAERPAWTRAELVGLAAERALLPDGALDAINETALEACGEPVCEGEDWIEINPEALKEVLA